MEFDGAYLYISKVGHVKAHLYIRKLGQFGHTSILAIVRTHWNTSAEGAHWGKLVNVGTGGTLAGCVH